MVLRVLALLLVDHEAIGTVPLDMDLVIHEQSLLVGSVRGKGVAHVLRVLAMPTHQERLVCISLDYRLKLALHLLKIGRVALLSPTLPYFLLLVLRNGCRPHHDRP